MRDKNGRDTHLPATMQKFEKKGVLGIASWKWLKIKVQICRDKLQKKRRINAEVRRAENCW
jgi:hypothetical protein